MRNAVTISIALLIILASFLPYVSASPANAQEYTEIVAKRTQTSKTFYLGGNSYQLIDTGPLHYQYNDTWQNINNAIVPAVAPWNYQMTQDAYTARFLSSFTSGQVVKWEAFNQSVAFQPMELQWTNDLNQISSISMPQNTAVLVTNPSMQLIEGIDTGYKQGTIRWDDAYGEGRHFWWVCDTGRLVKVLEIETNNLPAPPAYIISGGNPVLRLNFIFAPSVGLNIYVDGTLWDKSTTMRTFSAIDFQDSSGKTLWYFEPQRVWDSGGNATIATGELRRSGGNLYIAIRLSYLWLQSAVYPVFLDPTLTLQPDPTVGKDSYMQKAYPNENQGTSAALSVRSYTNYDHRAIIEFVPFALK